MIQTIHISSIKRHILMRMVPFLIPGVLLLSAKRQALRRTIAPPSPLQGGYMIRTVIIKRLPNDIDQKNMMQTLHIAPYQTKLIKR